MDIKAQVNEIVEKVTKDEKIKEQFQKDPVKAVESVIGVDLPDDIVDQVIKAVQGKIATDKLSGAMDSIKKLF